LSSDSALHAVALVTPCATPASARWTFQQPPGDSGDLLGEFALSRDESVIIVGSVCTSAHLPSCAPNSLFVPVFLPCNGCCVYACGLSVRTVLIPACPQEHRRCPVPHQPDHGTASRQGPTYAGRNRRLRFWRSECARSVIVVVSKLTPGVLLHVAASCWC
jgi:hypothetical protein